MSRSCRTTNVPIFIIGTERSGTNLLRLMLNSHSSITVPHPPHIMKLFTPLEPMYGDLANDANFRRLVNDVCRMVELHPYPWEIKPDREQVFRESRERNLICIYFAIYDQYLSFSAKRRWCCKSTFMIDHVEDILRYYPGALFIFMVRDGRDVSVSARESIFNHCHVYYTALRWQREQRLGLDWLARLPSEQILLLKYEELLAAPKEKLQQLCSFLGEEYEEKMLEYHRSSEAQKSGSLSISWQNTARPLQTGNKEKYRTRLSRKELFQFEAIAMREMQELGYTLTQPLAELVASREEMLQPSLLYLVEDFLLSMRAEIRHLCKDRNSLLRIRKIFFMRQIALSRKNDAGHNG